MKEYLPIFAALIAAIVALGGVFYSNYQSRRLKRCELLIGIYKDNIAKLLDHNLGDAVSFVSINNNEVLSGSNESVANSYKNLIGCIVDSLRFLSRNEYIFDDDMLPKLRDIVTRIGSLHAFVVQNCKGGLTFEMLMSDYFRKNNASPQHISSLWVDLINLISNQIRRYSFMIRKITESL